MPKRPPVSLYPTEVFFWSRQSDDTPELERCKRATEMSDAENSARRVGMRFAWEADHARPELWQCTAYLGGAIVGHLGEIDLGQGNAAKPWINPYAREIEAELAHEHLDDVSWVAQQDERGVFQDAVLCSGCDCAEERARNSYISKLKWLPVDRDELVRIERGCARCGLNPKVL